uniref:non-specific serine/threonine protein kinase n=1 Tax=Ammonifex degensii TaxID=42838 RepID=A0A7C2I288_9THEO
MLNRFVTLKILRDEYARDEDFVRRFRQEARAVASLSHPNIVGVFDVGCDDGIHYLVMEYVEGQNLKTLIKEGKISLSAALAIIRDICDALEHAHERGVIHRDVKPHNILVTATGRAKLTDFGIARALGSTTMGATKVLLGSVQYISPEQARGEAADARSDIYSLGAVLYEMLTGKPPFTGDNPVAVAIKHIQDNPLPVDQANPQLPPALKVILEKAMAKNPSSRYQTVAAMAADLDDLANELPILDSPTRPFGLLKKRRLKPAGYLLLGLVPFLLLAAAWWGLKWYLYVPEVTVPDVQGMTAGMARQTLEKYGLRVQVQEVNNATVDKNKVIKQDIKPGSRVKKGRLVTLLVSLGPEMATVPDVRNKPLQDAEMILVNEDFTVGLKKEVFHDEIPAGTVVDQEPAPGTSRPKEAPVNLVVSKGPRPVKKPVPELLGLTLEAARAKLNEAGFTLSEETVQQPSTEYFSGYVCAQNPAAGTHLEAGKAVEVTVSTGPGPAPKEATVYLPVPDDGQEHAVRITVTDARGLVEACNTTYPPGERVIQPITYYGQATIRVYLDERLVKEQTLS